jgi:hypothetical protein
MRLLWMCCALVLLAGCERDRDPSAVATAQATHPWELEGWQAPEELERQAQSAAEDYDVEQQVEFPNRRGPALPDADTLDPQLLPGAWLHVCYVKVEKLDLVPPGEMNVFDLRPDGSGTYFAYHNFEAAPRGTQEPAKISS